MLTATLLLIGAVLLAMSLAQTLVARLPLSPALLYLAVGWAAAFVASPPLPAPDLMAHATLLRVLAEGGSAVDAAIAGVTTEDLRVLDEGTRRAQGELKAMSADLKANADEHAAFMRQIARLHKAANQ